MSICHDCVLFMSMHYYSITHRTEKRKRIYKLRYATYSALISSKHFFFFFDKIIQACPLTKPVNVIDCCIKLARLWFLKLHCRPRFVMVLLFSSCETVYVNHPRIFFEWTPSQLTYISLYFSLFCWLHYNGYFVWYNIIMAFIRGSYLFSYDNKPNLIRTMRSKINNRCWKVFTPRFA